MFFVGVLTFLGWHSLFRWNKGYKTYKTPGSPLSPIPTDFFERAATYRHQCIIKKALCHCDEYTLLTNCTYFKQSLLQIVSMWCQS